MRDTSVADMRSNSAVESDASFRRYAPPPARLTANVRSQMRTRIGGQGKAILGSLVAVAGWIIVYLTVSPWWVLTTMSERATGLIEHLLTVVVATAPTLLYFLIVGALFGHRLGALEGSKWALLSAAAAMCVYAWRTEVVLYGSIDMFIVLLLAFHFILPLVIAVAGAASSRIWRIHAAAT